MHKKRFQLENRGCFNEMNDINDKFSKKILFKERQTQGTKLPKENVCFFEIGSLKAGPHVRARFGSSNGDRLGE